MALGVAVVFTAVVIGLGAWLSMTAGHWLALVLVIGLSAPIDVMLIRRHQHRAPAK